MIFELGRICQINSCKNMFINVSIQQIFLVNFLGSEQLHVEIINEVKLIC